MTNRVGSISGMRRYAQAGAILLSIAFSLMPRAHAEQVAITMVHSRCNPWLAGESGGKRDEIKLTRETAPNFSPALAADGLQPATPIEFSVSGSVNAMNATTGLSGYVTASGDVSRLATHAPSNGKSGVTAPAGALMGVFLPPNAAGVSDFRVQGASIPYYRLPESGEDLSPAMGAVFYIGEGTRRDGSSYRVISPNEPSRLFLGVMGDMLEGTSGQYQVRTALGTESPIGSMTSGSLATRALFLREGIAAGAILAAVIALLLLSISLTQGAISDM